MSIDVMKQALEALEECTAYTSSESWSPSMTRECEAAITALREALAQRNDFNPDWDAMAVMVEEQQRMAKRIAKLEAQPEQEPVAWLVQYPNKHEFVWGERPQWIAGAIGIEPLYTAPRQWQGLTRQEFLAVTQGLEDLEDCWMAIEAKLKEKNS